MTDLFLALGAMIGFVLVVFAAAWLTALWLGKPCADLVADVLVDDSGSRRGLARFQGRANYELLEPRQARQRSSSPRASSRMKVK